MFGSSIEGVQKELLPGKRIVQDLRFDTWPDGHYSKVRFAILGKRGNVAILLCNALQRQADCASYSMRFFTLRFAGSQCFCVSAAA